jgi:Uncharacterized protein conserved in bacteria (DUF2188)
MLPSSRRAALSRTVNLKIPSAEHRRVVVTRARVSVLTSREVCRGRSRGEYGARLRTHRLKGEQWVNEIEGGSEFGGTHSTKEDAVTAGRARAQQDKTEHVIHNQDGTISERSSYGNDPASRAG